MNAEIQAYNASQPNGFRLICAKLGDALQAGLPKAESKIWHGAPVWFIEGNPVAGYWVRKGCVQLLFWSGQSFGEPRLSAEGKFKAAEIRFTQVSEIKLIELRRWMKKARMMQWDYKNIVKQRGVLEKIGVW